MNKQSTVTAILPQDLKWNSIPALPKGVEVANLLGDPNEKTVAPWAARIKFPANVKLMPHSHSDTRYLTVLSGTYYQGVSERFDEKSARAFPPGSFLIVPAGVKHFVWAKEGEVIVQESGTSPSETIYVEQPAQNETK
ncbi:MAG: cupin domain-containing protein [Acidobacteriota bacterium]|nr:cupin domain-containing protein [Acidobacteriota bacterium]